MKKLIGGVVAVSVLVSAVSILLTKSVVESKYQDELAKRRDQVDKLELQLSQERAFVNDPSAVKKQKYSSHRLGVIDPKGKTQQVGQSVVSQIDAVDLQNIKMSGATGI
jgi:hypothetical protein